MRNVLSIGLALVMAAAGVPGTTHAVAQESAATATLTGTARTTNLLPISNASVQIRSTTTGDVVARTTADQAGQFGFAGVPPGSYVVEVLDAAGRIAGITAPLDLTAGAAATMSVMAASTGAAAQAGGGISLFGLGPVASMAVLGAAGAAAVTAVVATRPDASPSR